MSEPEEMSIRKQCLVDYIRTELCKTGPEHTHVMLEVQDLDFIEAWMRDTFVTKEELE